MIEVFKTNVSDAARAREILDTIHRMLPDCSANFDLDDCDRILRVVCNKGTMNVDAFLVLIGSMGCRAEVLQDEPHPVAFFPYPVIG